MVKLRFHQRTFDLLTQEQIDPQQAVEEYDAMESLVVNLSNEEKAKRKARLEKERIDKLAWTKLQLHNRQPAYAVENIRKLDELEVRHGVRLPASVREWFSLDFVPAMMFAQGYPVALEDIRPVSQTLYESHPNKRDDHWFFLHDEYIEQGGEHLCFSINDDDPPVLAHSGEQYVEIDTAFSHFIYVHFWDWLSRYRCRYMVRIVSHPAVQSLKVPERFHLPIQKFEERFEVLANNLSTRFFDDHTRIWVYPLRIWNQQELKMEHYPGVISGCEIRCDSPEALRMAIRYLWENDPPMYHMKTWPGYTKSETYLKNMQIDLLMQVLSSAEDWLSELEIAIALGSSIPVLGYPFKSFLDVLVHNGKVEAEAGDRITETLYRVTNRQ